MVLFKLQCQLCSGLNIYQTLSSRAHLLQQILSPSAINETRMKISFWNLQFFFYLVLSHFDKKKLAITQSECQSWPISAQTLDIFRKDFSISFKKQHFEIFVTVSGKGCSLAGDCLDTQKRRLILRLALQKKLYF